jgi:hypothetical protein
MGLVVSFVSYQPKKQVTKRKRAHIHQSTKINCAEDEIMNVTYSQGRILTYNVMKIHDFVKSMNHGQLQNNVILRWQRDSLP